MSPTGREGFELLLRLLDDRGEPLPLRSVQLQAAAIPGSPGPTALMLEEDRRNLLLSCPHGSDRTASGAVAPNTRDLPDNGGMWLPAHRARAGAEAGGSPGSQRSLALRLLTARSTAVPADPPPASGAVALGDPGIAAALS